MARASSPCALCLLCCNTEYFAVMRCSHAVAFWRGISQCTNSGDSDVIKIKKKQVTSTRFERLDLLTEGAGCDTPGLFFNSAPHSLLIFCLISNFPLLLCSVIPTKLLSSSAFILSLWSLPTSWLLPTWRGSLLQLPLPWADLIFSSKSNFYMLYSRYEKKSNTYL